MGVLQACLPESISLDEEKVVAKQSELLQIHSFCPPNVPNGRDKSSNRTRGKACHEDREFSRWTDPCVSKRAPIIGEQHLSSLTKSVALTSPFLFCENESGEIRHPLVRLESSAESRRIGNFSSFHNRNRDPVKTVHASLTRNNGSVTYMIHVHLLYSNSSMGEEKH